MDLQVSLAVAQAMADELTDYLLGGQLYRQMVVKTPAGTRQPKMTLGALLEVVQFLDWHRDELGPALGAQLDAIEQQIATAKGAFRLQWYELLQTELRALLGSWRWYLDEMGRNPKAKRDYPTEARIRSRIDLVRRDLTGDPAIRDDLELLNQLDERLKRQLQPGSYVGPEGEESHYPRQKAWWLYGMPEGADQV